MIWRRICCIKKNCKGQALVEFILCALLFSLLFTGVVFFGEVARVSCQADIAGRNKAMSGQGQADQERFRRYIKESAEMAWFVRNYEQRLNPAARRFYQLKAEGDAKIEKGAFPAFARRFQYSSLFVLDFPDWKSELDLKSDAQKMLWKDLFNIESPPEEKP